MKILQHATKPCTNLVCGCALNCVGKFPLADFYSEGHKALTQVDWVRYFIEVSSKASDHQPGLKMLSKVCQTFLKKMEQKQKQEQIPPYLPSDLALGTRDFPNSSSSGVNRAEDDPVSSSYVFVGDTDPRQSSMDCD